MLEQIIGAKSYFGTMPLTPELKKQAKKAVLSRFDSVKNDRMKRKKFYDELEKIYLSGVDGSVQNKQTLAEVMTTDGFNSVEDWVALIMDAMFPTDPAFDVEGRKNKLSYETKNKIKKVLQDNMNRTDYHFEFEKVCRQGVKYGTFVAKGAYWITDPEPMLKVEDVQTILKMNTPDGEVNIPLKNEDGTPSMEKQMSEVIDIDPYAGYKFVSMDKLYFRNDKLSWMIELMDSNWDEVEKQSKLDYPMYDNLEKAMKTAYPEKTSESTDLDQDVELMEAHQIPLRIKTEEGMKKVLCIVTLANREEVIRVQPTPYRKAPYLFNQFFEKKGVEGMGLMEILKKMLIEINTRRTQALDANTMGLYGMKAVNMRYIKKPEQLKIRKDGLIELKETDKNINEIIQFFRPPVEYANIAMDLLGRISSDIIRTTRMKGVLAGEKVTPNPTASEWQGMMKEALKSIKVILQRISRYQIEEWLQRAYILNVFNREKSWKMLVQPEQKNLTPMMPPPQPGLPPEAQPQPQPPIIEEAQVLEITPEDIYSDGIDIKAVGVSYMRDEVVVRQQQMQKLDLLVKYQQLPLVNEQGQQVQIDYYKQLVELLVSFGDDDPKDSFVIQPPPPPPQPEGGNPAGANGQGPNTVQGAPANMSQQGVPPDVLQMLNKAMNGAPGKANF